MTITKYPFLPITFATKNPLLHNIDGPFSPYLVFFNLCVIILGITKAYYITHCVDSPFTVYPFTSKHISIIPTKQVTALTYKLIKTHPLYLFSSHVHFT